MIGHRFDDVLIRDSTRLVLARRLLIAFVAVNLALAAASGWRAWFQVKSLDLKVSSRTIRSGSIVATEVVSYARTPVDVRIELVQGAHAETLALQTVRDNPNAALDPRTRRAFQTIVVRPENLATFAPGKAVVRATAIGRPQWLRVPPPLVREEHVEIVR